MGSRTITVATWNTEWSPTGGKRGPLLRARLRDITADILVVAEGQRGVLPSGGFVVDAGNDWGYQAVAHRRKTLLWSRWPLASVVRVESGAGRGNVVLARVESPFGQVNLLGRASYGRALTSLLAVVLPEFGPSISSVATKLKNSPTDWINGIRPSSPVTSISEFRGSDNRPA